MLKHFLAVATLVTVFFTTSVNAATLGTTKGGANYQIGIILNKVLNKAGVNIVPLPHRSTQRYLERIHNEEVDFGIGNPANLTWGYHGTNASKKAHKNRTTLKEESVKSGLITEKEYDKIVNPKKMIKPY